MRKDSPRQNVDIPADRAPHSYHQCRIEGFIMTETTNAADLSEAVAAAAPAPAAPTNAEIEYGADSI
jgi:hypothetical protein